MDDDYDNQRTLIDANHYYETSSYEAQKINKIRSKESTR
jgi:hypothetical protein